MATITLRLPDSMDKALARQSAASGLSKSDLAREALGPISTWANFASSGASSFRLRRHVGFTPSHLNRSTRTLSSS